uniref:Vms1-associating treble clef domain-containing protein n=1 Tax=Palpitomonas bilix TaxID=652834 RepID=A0A7S3DCH2_9EUKA|mmetsp:Transcript_29613/g.76509  ORF Transcript_29613/g.76509 Transcript_29613/m.76509 type:complete len:435 (+) Transcript_29613:165-1469(+)
MGEEREMPVHDERCLVTVCGSIPKRNLGDGKVLVLESVFRDRREQAVPTTPESHLSLATQRSACDFPCTIADNLLLESKMHFMTEVEELKLLGCSTMLVEVEYGDTSALQRLKQLAEEAKLTIAVSLALTSRSRVFEAEKPVQSPQLFALELLRAMTKPDHGIPAASIGEISTTAENGKELQKVELLLRAALAARASLSCPIFVEFPVFEEARSLVFGILNGVEGEVNNIVFTQAERALRPSYSIEQHMKRGFSFLFSPLRSASPFSLAHTASRQTVILSELVSTTLRLEREYPGQVMWSSVVRHKCDQKAFGGPGYGAAFGPLLTYFGDEGNEDTEMIRTRLTHDNALSPLCWYSPPKEEKKAIPKWECDNCGKRVSTTKDPFRKFDGKFCSMKCLRQFVEQNKPQSSAPSTEGFHKKGGSGASDLARWDVVA